MKIETKSGQIDLIPANHRLIDDLKGCWPLGIRINSQNTATGLIIQKDAQEMWGVRLCVATIASEEYAIDWLESRRLLVPMALNEMSPNLKGVLLPCPSYQSIGNGNFQVGFAFFSALSTDWQENLALLPKNANDRDRMYHKFAHDTQWEPLLHFINNYNQILIELTGEKELFDAPEILPACMIGNFAFEFMLYNRILICLHEKIDPGSFSWELLASCKINKFFHLPTQLVNEIEDPAYSVNRKDFYVTTEAVIEETTQIVSTLNAQ